MTTDTLTPIALNLPAGQADTEPTTADTPQRALLRSLTATFKARMDAQSFRPGSARYQQAALEFFCGATAALEAAGAPIKLSSMLAFTISVGRDPVKEWA